MRIIILTAIPFWHPGTTELIQHLRKRGVQISALDIFHGKQYNAQGEIENLIPFKLTGLAARIYMKLFRKSFTKKHTQSADILDIHFVEPYYAKYIPTIGKKYICTLFGSDLFRTNSEQKTMQKILFEKADRILLSKNMVPYFESEFGAMSSKYHFNQYGSERLDTLINKHSEEFSRQSKIALQLPVDKVIITCGYSAIAEQQHLNIINSLSALEKNVKDQIHLVFPMTYGGTDEYKSEVKEELRHQDFTFSVFESRLTDDMLVKLRSASDITINMQTTDALASSIKEAFASGDVVIAGEWLPYDLYQQLGVFFKTTSFETLSKTVEMTILNLVALKIETESNKEIIRNFASWNQLIPNWLDGYDRLYNEN